MTIKNLSIVWAPNLLRSRELETQGGLGALQCIAIQAVLTEYLIRFVDRLFTDESCPPFERSATNEEELSPLKEPEPLNRSQLLTKTSVDKSVVDVVCNNSESPVSAHKCLNVSTSSTKLITLKEARTRWEKRKMLSLNTELANESKEISPPFEPKSPENPNQIYFDRQQVLFWRVMPIEEPRTQKPEERISPRVLRPRPTQMNKTFDSNEELNANSTFGVLGPFGSSRRKKRFGNLEFSSPVSPTSLTDSERQNFTFRTVHLKLDTLDCLEGNKSSTDSLDIRSNHSEETVDNKQYATLEQFPSRYHTILNPKHFRKNQVVPVKLEESELDRVFKSRTNRIGKL